MVTDIDKIVAGNPHQNSTGSKAFTLLMQCSIQVFNR